MAFRDCGVVVYRVTEHSGGVSAACQPSGNFGGRHTECACYTRPLAEPVSRASQAAASADGTRSVPARIAKEPTAQESEHP